jgi:ABC-type molybdenum transport system ATPase subunit/photorepair protein PhrA
MKKVTVSYGGRAVLNGIDWTIWRGEHWAVIGPNGAGKSTLLNLITGAEGNRRNSLGDQAANRGHIHPVPVYIPEGYDSTRCRGFGVF